MGLKDTIVNLFKSKETKKKEATAAQEAAAEQELQQALSSPSTLKNLCSILNVKDAFKILDACTKMKGKQLPDQAALPKASELVGTARWGTINQIVERRMGEAEIAQQWRKVQQLGTKAAKGGLSARSAYIQSYENLGRVMKTHTLCQNVESSCVLQLLQVAILSGRIKDIDKLQSLVKAAQVENHSRRVKLGLIDPSQPAQKPNAGKGGVSR